MEKLPDLVKAALSSACNSSKILSWKVQESEKGTLIQLVWKPRLERQDRDSALGFNWNSRNSMQLSYQCESETNRILVSRKRKRMTHSRARRNAKRLQAFLERKSMNAPPATSSSLNQQQVCTYHSTVDTELKSFMDKEVECVDFRLVNGEPGLDLELKQW